MFSTVVLVILFFFSLCAIWLLLIGAKVHDKVADKVTKFTKQNLDDKKGVDVE